MSGRIVAYHPGSSFPSVSVTGGACDLQCDHCRGRHLRHMMPATSPAKLLEIAEDLRSRGGSGLLISGGCDALGRIPLRRFAKAIRAIKAGTDLLVNLHTGLLDRKAAEDLVATSADCFSVDVVQDEAAIRDMLHLRSGPDAYALTLDSLFDAGAKRVVPHVCVGLSSSTEGDLKSLDLIAGYDVSALVVLTLLPTRGTPVSELAPVPDVRVESFVREAVARLDCPVLLGCMRPRGNYSLEMRCIDLGVGGMAVPARKAIELAKEKGYVVETKGSCCALHV